MKILIGLLITSLLLLAGMTFLHIREKQLREHDNIVYKDELKQVNTDFENWKKKFKVERIKKLKERLDSEKYNIYFIPTITEYDMETGKIRYLISSNIQSGIYNVRGTEIKSKTSNYSKVKRIREKHKIMLEPILKKLQENRK